MTIFSDIPHNPDGTSFEIDKKTASQPPWPAVSMFAADSKTGTTCNLNSIAIASFHLKRIEQIWAKRIYVFSSVARLFAVMIGLTERLRSLRTLVARFDSLQPLQKCNHDNTVTDKPILEHGFAE